MHASETSLFTGPYLLSVFVVHACTLVIWRSVEAAEGNPE